MKKPHSFTRMAASLLLFPILYGLLIVLLYAVGYLVMLEFVVYFGMILLALMPLPTVGACVTGIVIQIQGIRKGEDKSTGIWVIAVFVILITAILTIWIGQAPWNDGYGS